MELDFDDFKTHNNISSNVSSPVSNSNAYVIQESKGDDVCCNVGKEVNSSSTDRNTDLDSGSVGGIDTLPSNYIHIPSPVMIEDESTQDSITSKLQKTGLDVPEVSPPTEAEFAQARIKLSRLRSTSNSINLQSLPDKGLKIKEQISMLENFLKQTRKSLLGATDNSKKDVKQMPFGSSARVHESLGASKSANILQAAPNSDYRNATQEHLLAQQKKLIVLNENPKSEKQPSKKPSKKNDTGQVSLICVLIILTKSFSI